MQIRGLTDQESSRIYELYKKCGSPKRSEALAAQDILAAALTSPLRSAPVTGDIVSEIFREDMYRPDQRIEYPIDLFRLDNADEYIAYTVPNQGRIPQRSVAGDYITVPTFDVANSIDALIRYAAEANWNVLERMMEVLEAGHVKKNNDDGWHTILSAALDRNIMVHDDNAAAGQFTKRLLSLAKVVMRRNSGGNSTSLNRGKLTHLFLSPEAIEDMRNWDATEVDDFTRRELYLASDGSFSNVFGVTLVDLDELGEGQEYQNYYENDLGGTMPSGNLEIQIGLDLSKNDSFVRPIRQKLEIFADDYLHRENRFGFYSRAAGGFGVLFNGRSLLTSI